MWLDIVTADQSQHNKNNSCYLGHLDHVGELCQTGDWNHIMVGFQLVPGEVIKHLRPYNVLQYFSEHYR